MTKQNATTLQTADDSNYFAEILGEALSKAKGDTISLGELVDYTLEAMHRREGDQYLGKAAKLFSTLSVALPIPFIGNIFGLMMVFIGLNIARGKHGYLDNRLRDGFIFPKFITSEFKLAKSTIASAVNAFVRPGISGNFGAAKTHLTKLGWAQVIGMPVFGLVAYSLWSGTIPGTSLVTSIFDFFATHGLGAFEIIYQNSLSLLSAGLAWATTNYLLLGAASLAVIALYGLYRWSKSQHFQKTFSEAGIDSTNGVNVGNNLNYMLTRSTFGRFVTGVLIALSGAVALLPLGGTNVSGGMAGLALSTGMASKDGHKAGWAALLAYISFGLAVCAGVALTSFNLPTTLAYASAAAAGIIVASALGENQSLAPTRPMDTNPPLPVNAP